MALYRTRSQGGSDFIGQVSFNLSELAASGTMQYPKGAGGMGVQARSITGSYPVVTLIREMLLVMASPIWISL